MVELKDIKAIIELMKVNDLSTFELEKAGDKLKIERCGQTMVTLPQRQTLPQAVTPAVALETSATPQPPPAPAPSGAPEIISPMVGTFYTAPSPESPPFVTVGQQVTEETVVCIIEAMKVMNEIKAEVRGVIAEVVAENGKPVQFGQALFRLK